MKGFHLFVLTCVNGVKDTQCGFKLFTRRTAHLLFKNQHIERWAFDVELLFLAQRFATPIVEVPVTWQEIDGSKLDPLSGSIQVALTLAFTFVRFVVLTLQDGERHSAHPARLLAWRVEGTRSQKPSMMPLSK
jgi:dolichyl-phosphate beta-glucosyltransferase